MAQAAPELIRYSFQTPEGGHTASYLSWPCRSGKPISVVVCVHGLTRNAHDFDRLADALSENHTVICPDVVGRGDSDWLDNPAHYGYPLYVSQMQQLLMQLMPTLGVTQVDWVGTSMGGLIGMMLAAQPVGPIGKLVMNDVGYFIPRTSLERLAGYVGKSTDFRTLEDVELYLRDVAASFGPLTDEQWSHLARYGAEQRQGHWYLRYDPAIAQAFTGVPLADVDLSAIWQAVNVDTLLIRGGDSDLLLPETAREMASQDNVQLAVFPGIGHAPALMARDQIRAIESFLQ